MDCVSKGEKPAPADKGRRLSSYEAQETYYRLILERCLLLKNSYVPADASFECAFDALDLIDSTEDATDLYFSQDRKLEQEALRIIGLDGTSETKVMPVVTQAMRKLREAIVATHRRDLFAQGAYVFMLHAAILICHVESYHPTILYLLRCIHPITPLSGSLHSQILGYHILDLACRQKKYDQAFEIVAQNSVLHPSIPLLVRALVRGDWVQFCHVKKGLQVYVRRLIDSSDHVSLHALSCIQKTYLSVDKQFIERTITVSWERLKTEHNLQWPMEQDILKIRQPRRIEASNPIASRFKDSGHE